MWQVLIEQSSVILPPYCVAVGVPAKPIKMKWTIDEILQHESKLYPEEERFSREELQEFI